MTELVAAEAPTTETSVVEPQETIQEAPQEAPVSEDDALSAAFDRMNETETDEATNPTPDEASEPVEAEAEPESSEPVAGAPSDLPRGVRDAWGDIPEGAREAIEQSHRDLTAKLGDQGRMMQGIAPVRDALVQAAEQFPHLANITPQQVSQELFQLAEVSHNFTHRPVETLVGFVRQHGLQAEMAAALNGQAAPDGAQDVRQMAQHIQKLEGQIAQMSDPEYMRTQVSQFTSEAQTVSTVDQFASTAEHWDAVETHMPSAIQFVQAKLGDGASPQDVLSQAYDLAVSQFVPEAKAKPTGVEQAPETVTPEKTKAQLRAKSVNVKSTPTGKAKPLTEDEALSAAWDKFQD